MKLFWMIVCGWIGATLFIIALFASFEPGWFHIVLYAGSVFFEFVAFVLLMVSIDDRRIDVDERLARIAIDTNEDLVRLDRYSRIPLPGWPYMMSERGLVIDTASGNPVPKVRLMFGEVPQRFIEKSFLVKYKDPNYVRPVRSYGENETWEETGGNCREYASICIQHILEKKYAGGQRNGPKHWTTSGRTQFQYECGLGIEDLNAKETRH